MLEPLVEMPEDVVKEMSTVSFLALKLLDVAVKGELTPDVSALLCGKLCRLSQQMAHCRDEVPSALHE